MKKRIKSIFLSFCLIGISLLCHSCCETIQPEGPYYLDSNLVKIFIPGDEDSYWVYKNLTTNTLDTFCTATYRKTQNGGKPVERCRPTFHKKDVGARPYSEQLLFSMKSKTNSDSLAVELNSGSETILIFPYPYSFKQSKLDSYTYLPSREVLANTYTDVYKITLHNSMTFYFAKGVGLIEWESYSLYKNHQLLNYKL